MIKLLLNILYIKYFEKFLLLKRKLIIIIIIKPFLEISYFALLYNVTPQIAIAIPTK